MSKSDIKEFCEQIGIREAQFFGKEKIEGWLRIHQVKSIPANFSPIVDHLWIGKLETFPNNFSPVVICDMYFEHLESIPANFSPVVGGDLWIDGLKSGPKNFSCVVGGNLWLQELETIPENFTPIAGLNLLLGSVQSIPENFSPLLGGYCFYYKERYRKGIGNKVSELLSWRNGLYRLVDDILCIFENAQPRIIRGFDVWEVKEVANHKSCYVAKKDSFYAHGYSINYALESLDLKLHKDKIQKERLSTDKYF